MDAITDLLHLFAQNPLLPSAYAPDGDGVDRANGVFHWVEGREGPIEIGHAGAGFAFDCEGPRHKVWLTRHALADRLVTNGEWRAFIEDRGYSTPTLWLSDGWSWCGRTLLKRRCIGVATTVVTGWNTSVWVVFCPSTRQAPSSMSAVIFAGSAVSIVNCPEEPGLVARGRKRPTVADRGSKSIARRELLI